VALRAAWRLLRTVAVDWWEDNTLRMSASLAYYTIFSLAPVLIIAVALASVVFGEEAAVNRVVQEIGWLVGPEGGKAAQDILHSFAGIGASPGAALLGIATILFGATVVFVDLQAALNRIWDVEPRPGTSFVRSLVRTRVLGFALALSVGFLLLVSLLVDAALTAAQAYLEGRLPIHADFWRTVNVVVSILTMTALFMAIYRVLPDAVTAWRDVAQGAVVSALLITAGKYLIGLYLGSAAVGSAYGAAGSLVVLLVWVYFSAQIAFVGAEFTQVWARMYGNGIVPEPHARRIGRKPVRY
jgi:membrane protein